MPFEPEFHRALDQTERIDFEGGAWVEIRVVETIGDSTAGVDAITGLRTDLNQLAKDQAPSGEIDLSIGAFRLSTLQHRIVRWSSSEAITPESVARMPEEMAMEVLKRIDELAAGRSADEKKDSMTSASPTS